MTIPDRPGLDLLATGRMHEACGPGRRAFALALAGQAAGPVLWVLDIRRRDMLCPQGILPLLDPARLLIARPAGGLDALRVAEEALRAGAVPLVVAELEAAPDLTQSRRLQLAAGTGGGRGLCLVPETRLAANAAETRWHCAPMPSADGAALQHWEMVKNKHGRLGAWQVAVASAPGAPPLQARPIRGAQTAGAAAP